MANFPEEDEIEAALNLGYCTFKGKNRLGKGSFGVVVEAYHELSDRFYAVKMMPFTKDRIKYQKRELEALAKLEILKSKHVIQHFNSWMAIVQGKQFVCIRMELCLCSLGHLLKKNSHFVQRGSDLCKQIFPQILNGLVTIHDLGWVHRDLHWGNILIDNPAPVDIGSIVIKIADFGLARQIDFPGQPLSSKPMLEKISPDVGNVYLRAPEMSTSQYDYKVDLYSAGMLLYILSYCLNVEQSKWETKLKELRKDGVENVCDNKESLVPLVRALLKENPEERPTASEALGIFNDTKDAIDQPKANVEFLARLENERGYKRCTSQDDTLYGFKQAIYRRHGVPPNDQNIRTEVEKNGKQQDFIDVDCDDDIRATIRSAENKQRKICVDVVVRQHKNCTETTETFPSETETATAMSIDNGC